MHCCKASVVSGPIPFRCTATAHSDCIACAPAAAADPSSAVLLWLGCIGLRVLCRLLAPGRLGRDAVDLRRADDARLRLVARRAVGSGVGWRRACGAVL